MRHETLLCFALSLAFAFFLPGLQLTFSQTAATPIPDTTTLTAGTFRPANYGNTSTDLTDFFPSSGPGTLTDAPAD
jgi:hypothetical protein